MPSDELATIHSKLAELKAGVTAAAFRPTPLAPVMWAIRRILWPIIRQYHFYQVEQTAAILARLEVLEKSRLEAIEGSIANHRKEIAEEISKATIAHFKLRTDVAGVVNRQSILAQDFDELSLNVASMHESVSNCSKQIDNFTSAQANVATEVARVVDKQSILAQGSDDLSLRVGLVHESLATCSKQLEDFASAQTGLASEVASLSARASDFAASDRLNPILAEASQAHSRLDALDLRTRLGLAASPTGLFITKAGDLISDSIATTGSWDPHILTVIDAVSGGRDGVAIDVGANIGFITVAMAARFSRVLSFEPNSFNFQLLSANVALNGCRNVECLNEGLFSRETRISLADNSRQEIPLPITSDGTFDGLIASNLGAYSFVEKGTGISSVRARTLDSFDLSDVALIKIDVQGADGEVLAGARSTLERSRPVILFEWEEDLARSFGVSFQSVVKELENLDYNIEILKRTNEKQVDYIARPR